MKTIVLLFALSVSGLSLERPGIEYKIFQFPADKIPRIDGDPSDWSIVPETYSIGMDQLKETSKGRGFSYDKRDLDVKVKVDWVFVWGCQPWIKELPWANAAYKYNFKHGEAGKLILEFWITPFDYAPFDGPERAVVSKLVENKLIGLSWAVLDYDGPDEKDYKGFWNLSHKTSMSGNADDLVAFRLMPAEPGFRKPIEAHWSYKILDMDRRMVAFQDESTGQITSWRWDFGDGAGSTDQHPIHRYEKAGEYIVNLYIEGPAGKSRWTKVRDVVVR